MPRISVRFSLLLFVVCPLHPAVLLWWHTICSYTSESRRMATGPFSTDRLMRRGMQQHVRPSLIFTGRLPMVRMFVQTFVIALTACCLIVGPVLAQAGGTGAGSGAGATGGAGMRSGPGAAGSDSSSHTPSPSQPSPQAPMERPQVGAGGTPGAGVDPSPTGSAGMQSGPGTAGSDPSSHTPSPSQPSPQDPVEPARVGSGDSTVGAPTAPKPTGTETERAGTGTPSSGAGQGERR
jgi:hypothetical protein